MENRDERGRFIKGNLVNFKNGRRMVRGYVLIYSPNHPNKDTNSCCPEHHLVMEKSIFKEGNSMRMKTEIRTETISKLREAGLSFREIGRRVGLTHSNVANRLNNYGK